MNRRVLLTETGVAHVLDDENESITQFFPYKMVGDVRLDKKLGNLTISLTDSAEATMLVESNRAQAVTLYNRISLMVGAQTYEKGLAAIERYEKAVHEKFHQDQAARAAAESQGKVASEESNLKGTPSQVTKKGKK